MYDCATFSYYCQNLVGNFYISFYPDKGTLAKSESATSLWRDIKFIKSLKWPHNAGNKQFSFCYKSTAHFPTWNMIFRKLTPDSLLASAHRIKNNWQKWENVGLIVYTSMRRVFLVKSIIFGKILFFLFFFWWFV